jgi:hypothetical protein
VARKKNEKREYVSSPFVSPYYSLRKTSRSYINIFSL